MASSSRSKPDKLPLRLVFARNIRAARIHANVSQEALAHRAELDRAFVGTLERGVRNISIDNIELLAKAIGIPAHELLDPELPMYRGFDLSLTRSPRTTREPKAQSRRARKS